MISLPAYFSFFELSGCLQSRDAELKTTWLQTEGKNLVGLLVA